MFDTLKRFFSRQKTPTPQVRDAARRLANMLQAVEAGDARPELQVSIDKYASIIKSKGFDVPKSAEAALYLANQPDEK